MRSPAKSQGRTRTVTRSDVQERASAKRRRPVVQAFFRIDSSNRRYGRQHCNRNSCGLEQNKCRRRRRPVQTVIRQMLPFAVERLRCCALRRSRFLWCDRVVSRRDVYGQRKNSAKYQRSKPSVIPRSERDEDSRSLPTARGTWIPPFARDDNRNFVGDLTMSFAHSAGSPGTASVVCSLRLPYTSK
jgi:hypothetical protein